MIWLICPIFRFPLAAFPLRQFSPKQLKERQIRLSQELPSYFLPFTVGLNVVLPHAAAGGQGGAMRGLTAHARARRPIRGRGAGRRCSVTKFTEALCGASW